LKANKFIGTSVLMALVLGASASAFAQRGDEKQKEKAPPQQQQRQQAPPERQPQQAQHSQPPQQQQKQQTQPTRQPQQAQRTQPQQQTQPTRQPQQAQHAQPVQQQQQKQQAQPDRSQHAQQQQRSQPQQRDQRSSEQLRAAQQSRTDYRGSYAASTSRSVRYENRGGRIPDDRFRTNFGRDHFFRFHTQFIGGGYSRFQYGGFWFGMYDPWPYDWYDTDDVYVDFDSYSGNYFLYNRVHPGARLQINVVL
jgi:hypothetical protein